MSDLFQTRWQTDRAAWVAARGKKIPDSFGDLPRMTAGDAIVLVAPWTDAVRSAIIGLNYDPICGNDHIPAAGVSFDPAGLMNGALDAPCYPIDEYLMRGIPAHGRACLRTIPNVSNLPGISSVPIEPNWVDRGKQSGPDIMSHWQQAINAAASSLQRDLLSPMTDPELRGVWTATFNLAIALDVAGEVPNPTIWGALKHAKDASIEATDQILTQGANIAGQAAAHIAGTAGNVAQEFAKGFFGDLYPLAIACGAIYVASRIGAFL